MAANGRHLRCESSCARQADFEAWLFDVPAEDGASLGGGVQPREPQGRRRSLEVHQRHCPQAAAQRDVLVILLLLPGRQERGLLENVARATGLLCQREDFSAATPPPQVVLTIRRGGPDAERSHRDERPPHRGVPSKAAHCPHQGQLGVIRSLREGPYHRLHGLHLPVKHQAERMVGQQPGRLGPVARRLHVPDAVDNLAMLGKPCGGTPVQPRRFFGIARRSSSRSRSANRWW